jgi:DUF4097 and DUF4098 domain-containing protein YvlB
MPQTPFIERAGPRLAACALASLVLAWTSVRAGRTIEERRAADPQGDVEISNVSGVVEIVGWDRAEVEVSGTAAQNVERVDVTGDGAHTSIHVVSRSKGSWDADDDAHLTVHVPAKSAVHATLVSANFKLSGTQGDLSLRTVSGNVTGEAGGNVHADTVNGNITLNAGAARAIEVSTISGNIDLRGGGGEVDVTTVSGDAKIELGTLSRGRFKSVSGDFVVGLSLDADAEIDGESVSGVIRVQFDNAPAADFDVQSFSGKIDSCFGPAPTVSRYGPGSQLTFTSGAGHAHVRLETKSGDVHLCYKGAPGGRTARVATLFPYVL